MKLQQRIDALCQLGIYLNSQLIQYAKVPNVESDFSKIIRKAEAFNPWFSKENIIRSINHNASLLESAKILSWVQQYPEYYFNESSLKVGVIMAGNIPLVGFQDFLNVILSGKNIVIKLSSNDSILLPYIVEILIDIEPLFKTKIAIENHILKEFDAIIATGSNNSSRYFEQYFSKRPNIIRKNRNSVALIKGDESAAQFVSLGNDIFNYFGLGCRNVSKLLVPKGYDFVPFLDALECFSDIMQHTKYFNNYEYNKAILLINKEPHFDNGFLLLKEKSSLQSPVGVLHYEYYDNLEEALKWISAENDHIQCIISDTELPVLRLKFGQSQYPSLLEYADNVDVMKFLGNLNE